MLVGSVVWSWNLTQWIVRTDVSASVELSLSVTGRPLKLMVVFSALLHSGRVGRGRGRRSRTEATRGTRGGLDRSDRAPRNEDRGRAQKYVSDKLDPTRDGRRSATGLNAWSIGARHWRLDGRTTGRPGPCDAGRAERIDRARHRSRADRARNERPPAGRARNERPPAGRAHR
jgi:hypothetical protein